MDYNPSPSMVLPPPRQDYYFASSHYTNGNGAAETPSSFGTSATPNESIAPTPGSLAGRKRGRGDQHSPDEDDLLADGSSQQGPPTIIPDTSRGQPIYGPGMTLIYPDDPAYSLASASQSGTWVDDRAEQDQFRLAQIQRPDVRTRKSQRVDGSAGGADDLAQLVLPPQMREATREPLIDAATRALGISWTRMDSSEALRISRAAYAKWIQKHYPGLHGVAVWFENSAIPGYLVEANNAYSGRAEYYIFSHDLTEARLVTAEPEQLVPRLKMLPALHLAAPGGCIYAETDPVTADEDELSQPNGICAAHSMELD